MEKSEGKILVESRIKGESAVNTAFVNQQLYLA